MAHAVVFAHVRQVRNHRCTAHQHMDRTTIESMYQIYAHYDKSTITVYQAFDAAIASAAVTAGRFQSPFSFERMTWIKPSFLWLMHRSNWAQRKGQTHILAIRITRTGWEKALSLGVLTEPNPRVYQCSEEWSAAFARASVLVQWDPDRDLRGQALGRYAIQVGLSRHIIHEYVDDWIVAIRDITPTVTAMRSCLRSGNVPAAVRLLPSERLYPTPQHIGRRLGVE